MKNWGDKVGSANTLNNLALLSNSLGENAQAIEYFLRSVRGARRDRRSACDGDHIE